MTPNWSIGLPGIGIVPTCLRPSAPADVATIDDATIASAADVTNSALRLLDISSLPCLACCAFKEAIGRHPVGLDAGQHSSGRAPCQSRIGSTFTIVPAWLLPTQSVPGLVRSSTKTRRILVGRGIWYSTYCPVLTSSRDTRSLSIEPVQAELSTPE